MAAPTVDSTVSGEQYQLIQHFYARQMQLLDAGDVESWVDTFTDDAVFRSNARTEPTIGRQKIIANVAKAVRDRVADRIVRRHWMGMFSVTPGDGDELRVRSYAMIFTTPHGGHVGTHLSAVCEDVLVPHGDTWLVRERSLSHDDLISPERP